MVAVAAAANVTCVFVVAVVALIAARNALSSISKETYVRKCVFVYA